MRFFGLKTHLKMKNNLHIIGGGINGILSALYVKKYYKDYTIFIHDSQSKIGGKLTGFEYQQDNLYFDKGTHIFQESGNRFLDKTLMKSIEVDKLIYFNKGKGDIVGSIQNDYLNIDSHYLDLRNNLKILSSVKTHLSYLNKPIKHIDIYSSVTEQLKIRFGYDFAIQFAPLFSDIFKKPAEELSSICLLFTGFTRVVLDDLPKWKTESTNEIYRSLVGVPNQFNLPLNYMHNKRSFYAKGKGTQEFINGLEKKIISKGIKVIRNSKINKICKIQKQIEFQERDSIYKLGYDKILISSGVLSAIKLMQPTFKIDLTPPMKSAYINLELKYPTKNNLFYFYNYSSTLNFYRVTNYRAFSREKNDKRITIECFLPNENLDVYCQKILYYLKSINFIDSVEYNHCYFEEQFFGFPVLTIDNIKKMKVLSKHLDTLLDKSIQVSGVGTENFNFFTNEILINGLKKIDQLLLS